MSIDYVFFIIGIAFLIIVARRIWKISKYDRTEEAFGEVKYE
jgi:hypothetical protein